MTGNGGQALLNGGTGGQESSVVAPAALRLSGSASLAEGGSSGGAGGDGAAGEPAVNVGCGRPRGQVSVGGVDGLDSFVDASHSARLRACGASLYVHQVGWGALTNDQQRRQIAANFLGTGGISLEMAEATNLQTDYLALGVESITEVLINAPDCEVPGSDTAIETWRGWVDQWRAQGVKRAEYNDTPNCHFPVDWSSSTWDDSRERARIGGGVVLDSPPYFYYDVGPADYRAFVRAEVAWANANGLHSTWILSPGDGHDFLADTQQLIAEVNALLDNARPQEWVVEGYGIGGPVGDENVAGSVANVALWVVNHAETFRP